MHGRARTYSGAPIMRRSFLILMVFLGAKPLMAALATPIKLAKPTKPAALAIPAPAPGNRPGAVSPGGTASGTSTPMAANKPATPATSGTTPTPATPAGSASPSATPSGSASSTSNANAILNLDNQSIVDAYPVLQKFIFTERASNTYIGFGLSPITIVNSKLAFSLNLFQVHYIAGLWDIELLSVSYGFSFGANQAVNSDFFVFRTMPKFKLFNNISIGPLIGLEFVSFPGLQVQLNKNNFFTPSEAFSTSGFIMGASISETFNIGNYLLKVSQIGYKETYSYTGTKNGWAYYFPDNSDINQDPTPIKPSFVIVLELSFLY